MVREIEWEARYASAYTGKETIDPHILQVFEQVPRHDFVPERMSDEAYENGPLPIGHGQTISQPYIVALMIDLIEPKPEHTVLDIGTGSGYQAAILSHLVAKVYGVEIVEPLAEQARRRLKKMGCQNVEVKTGDGNEGWAEHGPYDGILVAAATPTIPQALVEQLKLGGKLVLPIGEQFYAQELVLVTKSEDGKTQIRNVLPVSFVPLVSRQ